MNHSLEATYYRTALLLGLVRGDEVLRWAQAVIEREPTPSAPFFEIVSVAPADLSELRHALWPLVQEPDPLTVLHSILAVLHRDLSSGSRSLADTLTILRQMRSMLKLPHALYADLNAALVDHADAKRLIGEWLLQFAETTRDAPSAD